MTVAFAAKKPGSRRVFGWAVAAAVAILPTAAGAGEFGLAITSIHYGPYDDPTDCPQGLTVSSKEYFLETLSPADRKAWEDRDKRVGSNAQYLAQLLVDKRGPHEEDLCHNPTLYKEPPMRTGQSTKGYGLDLDGGDTSAHCAHKEFVGENGQTGIDNQVGRLTACMLGYQKNRDASNRGHDSEILSDGAVMLLRVTNVDDVRNSANVTVDLYKGADPLVKDGNGAALPDATLDADRNALRFRATTHGKIVNGVLMTDPVDIHVLAPASLTQTPGTGWFIKGARLQINLHPDGYEDGILAGYNDLESYFDWWTRTNPGGRVSTFSCPALYQAMHDLADGYKDPKTGQCTALSTAINIKAVRTFVMPPDEKLSRDEDRDAKPEVIKRASR